MSIGKRIKRIRESHNDSQQDLAIKIGKKQGLISAIERDTSSITTESLSIICKEYNVSADWILFGYESDSLTMEEQKIIKGYRSCTEKEKGRIEEIIDSSEGSKSIYDKVGNLY